MRLFNELVIDQYVRGTAEVVSPPQWNELLGRADDLVYEVEVEESTGTSPTITIRHLQSNSGKKFVGLANLINAAAIDNLPFRDIKTQAGPLGGLGQVGVQLGASSGTPTARVRIWACGRAK